MIGKDKMTANTNTIDFCEVCGNNQLLPVLDLGNHPMCDDLIPIGNARRCVEYPIDILFCKKCLTAHQHYQVPKQELFPASYHYRSRFTADVLNGMENLVASCEQKIGDLTEKVVLDIGCNDGSLLDFFRSKGAITYGVEPTNAYLDAEANGHIAYNQYLSPEFAQEFVNKHGHPDIISFTNVFAHIENLRQVLESLKILMSPVTVIVIENHYLGSILESNQFDTFYHEHPRTYSYTSFLYMAKALGVDVLDVEFPARYGGNIRVFLGKIKIIKEANSLNIDILKQRESHFLDLLLGMQQKIDCWRTKKSQLIQSYVNKYGKLPAKAFPGRAAILIKLLGLDEHTISAVYEKPGSLKIGQYVPGTRIPIRSDDDLFRAADKTQPILNLAWHISSEIKAYLLKNGYQGEIIDILSPNDFL